MSFEILLEELHAKVPSNTSRQVHMHLTRNLASMAYSSRIFVTILFVTSTFLSVAQIGSITDKHFVELDKRLISLEIDGKIYAPRHGALSATNYNVKIKNSNGQESLDAIIRPVELFVWDKSSDGDSWKLAVPNPIFSSVKVGALLVQLDFYADVSIMKRISKDFFILATELAMMTRGSTQRTKEPVIFLFKMDGRPNYYPVSLEAVFRPSHHDNTRITDVQVEGATTRFVFGKSATATLTFDPDEEHFWMYRDSAGGFQGRAKD